MKIFLFAGAAFATLSGAPAFAQPPEGAPRSPGGPGMRMPQNRAEVQQMIQERFGASDANGDGGQGGPGGRGGGGNRFDRLDANRDGKLTLEELSVAFLARFDRIDANKDGTISDQERQTAFAAMRARREARGDDGPPPAGDEPPQE
jgi:hypothetical protein